MRYEKYKQTGIPWLPEVPEGWEYSIVGRCFDIQLGKMLCSSQPTEEYTLESYYCAANVHFEGVQTSDLKQMWFDAFEKSRYLVRNGDLLVVEGGAGAGGSAIVRQQISSTYMQNSILRLRSRSRVGNVYLCYWLESIVKRGYIEMSCNKATIPHFTKAKISQVPIPFPGISTQRAIVAYLDDKCGKIDELVAAKEKEVELLKELKQTVIADAVTRGISHAESPELAEGVSSPRSLRSLRENNRRLVPSGIPWLPQIPEGWEVKRLKCLFTMRDERYSSHEALRVLSLLKDVGVIPYEEKGAVGNKSKDDISQYKVARVGDIVMNSMNVIIGSVDISPYDGYISPAYYALTAREEVCVKYYNFIFHLSSVQKSMRSLAKGIMEIRLRISPTSLFGMYYPVPPLDEQRAIVAYIEEKTAKIDQAVAGLTQQVAALKEYKQRLIADVVTGQMRVA